MRTIRKKIKKYLDHSIGRDILDYSRISDKKDHISFDIFDTLVVRDLNEPKDLFRLMECRLNYPDFYDKRIRAENDARSKTSNGEVTLGQIYDSFPGLSSEEKALYCRKELETELQVCRPNPRLIAFYKECVKNKHVILISDMYLPSDMMKQILDKCGITGYEKLYISCEVGVSKRGGGLYRYVLSDLGISADEMLHIGNDIMSDAIGSEKAGVRSRKVRTQADALLVGRAPRRRAAVNKQFSLIYNFLNNTTCTNEKFRNFYYRFGYENFGIMLYGFCKWLAAEAEKQGIEQMLFIARDGYIIKKAYDAMGLDKRIPSRYLELSRRSIRIPASFSVPQSYEKILGLVHMPSRISVNQIIDTWGLDAKDCEKEIAAAGLHTDDIFWSIDLESSESVRKLYSALKEKIQKNAAEEKETMLEYLTGFGFADKKTAVIDIGYGANIQKELQRILASNNVIADITGYYLFLNERAKDNTDDLTLKAKGYVWDNYNRGGIKAPDEDRPFVGILEALFLEPKGSVKRYTRCGDSVLAERYECEYLAEGGKREETGCIRIIRRGAIDFIRQTENSQINRLKTISGKNAFFLVDRAFAYPTKEIFDHFYKFCFFKHGNIGFFKYMLKKYIHYETLRKELKVYFPSPKKKSL